MDKHITLLLKKGIWIYFILLIFEGALRKWVLPSLSTPLLVIRDPFAIWILITAYKYGIYKPNLYVIVSFFVVAVSLFTTILIGHGNIYVALYGARIFVIHFPLMFLIGRVLDKQDVLQIGYVILWIVLPMTLLMAFQFYSPQSAWVNKGIGDDNEGGGFSGAMGYFRPPGTFSFINGLTLFYSLAASFIFYFWLDNKLKKAKKMLLVASTICLFIAIPLSISRTLLFQVGLTVIFTAVAVGRNPKYISRLVFFIITVTILLSLLNNQSFFKTGIEVFNDRFQSANESEGGIISVFNRVFGGAFNVFGSESLPFFGYGIGVGTNVGAMLTTGRISFLFAEMEWGRLLAEFGLLLGGTIIWVRALLIIKISIASLKQLKYNNFLPWFLLSFGFYTILQGQWAQPTALGFAIFSGGIIISSLKSIN
ncbi:hypothetical protein [Spirosoma sp. KUDC1026]|uniref:hypothetical protein n=1 Tax=Spirosoma sp. KUDC1026 TaxID=2745947 RepID=UPI00159BDCEB|nr:hypothetical protein [Spirosoma sp. KUDC1026]QKZ15434.1 hypothetical protein HU175_23575 [Spirosoma sp. KUDC1026]